MKKIFPFKDSPNTACFTCCHVLNQNKPILYISHDDDGYWQFLCGQNHTEDDARVVSLADIFKIDSDICCSVAQVLDYGQCAENYNGSWTIK